MFDLLYLSTILPTLAVATLLFRLLLKKQQEAEKRMVAATVRSRRAAKRSEKGR